MLLLLIGIEVDGMIGSEFIGTVGICSESQIIKEKRKTVGERYKYRCVLRTEIISSVWVRTEMYGE